MFSIHVRNIFRESEPKSLARQTIVRHKNAWILVKTSSGKYNDVSNLNKNLILIFRNRSEVMKLAAGMSAKYSNK